jgi:hypothetical protein
MPSQFSQTTMPTLLAQQTLPSTTLSPVAVTTPNLSELLTSVLEKRNCTTTEQAQILRLVEKQTQDLSQNSADLASFMNQLNAARVSRKTRIGREIYFNLSPLNATAQKYLTDHGPRLDDMEEIPEELLAIYKTPKTPKPQNPKTPKPQIK